jgi:DNA ligase-1|tara:strand:- start:29 stop:805 length:777 start_codon:yes stop_codon:yes gene_type:complete
MQPKLDGVRCIIQLNNNNELIAYSRTGKPWLNIKHILHDLKPFFDEHPDVILDGELYNHDLRDDFNKIISLVRKTKPTDLDRSEAAELVQFHCYDYANGSDSYGIRMRNLSVSDMYSYCVKYVPTHRVATQSLSKVIHEQNLNDGYEGSILRLDEPYQRKRSYNLQKFKDFHDTEATIVGYVPGKGKRTGTLGKFLMIDDEGVEFGCPPGKGYNYKDLANILNNVSDYIGKRATFTYFERTPAGSYRHPFYKAIRNYE